MYLPRLLRPSVGRRRARRESRKIVEEVIPHGVYLQKQWGKDTRTSRTVDTEVVVSTQTLILTADPFIVDVADTLISLGCVKEVFEQAGFPSMWLFNGLEELGAAEIRRFRRRELVRLRTRFGIPFYPRVLAVMRLTHIKYGRVRSRTYEYWVLFEVSPQGCVPVDWNFGAGRPGRPKVR